MPRLRRLMIGGSIVATAVLAPAVPAAAVTVSAGLPIARADEAVSPTAGGSNDYFNSDSCTSGAFCMAVGAYNLGGHAHGLSEMLRGEKWVPEPVPSPARGVNVFANEISCASPASCLFVGDHWAGRKGPAANLAETWNGSSWRIVTATGPAGSAISGLDDVACPTTRFCLAVGFAGPSRRSQNTAYTWTNGKTWRRISVPRPTGARNSELGGLACFDSSNCMAVGNYQNRAGHDVPFAARWHNGRWRLLATPAVRRQRDTSFQGISCPTVTLCMAVGNTEDNTRGRYFHAFAEVWTNGKWHVSTLRRSPSLFLGASCPTRNRCFAAGYTFPSPTTFARPLIETWNGLTWTTQHAVQTAAPRAGDVMAHVSCVNRSDCVAAGDRFKPSVSNNTQTLAEMWNGHRWTVQATANP
ncbi:MAG TPA: hypothetical protein VGI66_02755 [Streptosporangiaceae bacterium]